jgi:hypothetical protein
VYYLYSRDCDLESKFSNLQLVCAEYSSHKTCLGPWKIFKHFQKKQLVTETVMLLSSFGGIIAPSSGSVTTEIIIPADLSHFTSPAWILLSRLWCCTLCEIRVEH